MSKSVNRASEVWDLIKPFAVGWFNSVMSQAKGEDTGSDPYAIILYDESGQKKRTYSFSVDGLRAALAAAVAGDVVWLPAGILGIESSLFPSLTTNTKTLYLGTGNSGNNPPANWNTVGFDDSAWLPAREMTHVDYDRVAGAQQLWSPVEANYARVAFRHVFTVNNTVQSALLKWDGDDRINGVYVNGVLVDQWLSVAGGDDHPARSVDISSLLNSSGANVVAVDAYDGIEGSVAGGMVSWIVTVNGQTITIPAGVELVGLGKSSIIPGDVVNDGILTNLRVTGTIFGNGICRMVANPDAEVFSQQIKSEVANGTPPLEVESSTLVENFNADKLDGEDADAFADAIHASQHLSGGADAIKLDDLAAPDDNTDLDATTSKHGLLPKLPADEMYFLNGAGGWSIPAGGGEGGGAYYPQHVLAMIDQFKILAGGGSFTRAVHTSQSYAFYAYPSTQADGDAISTTICIDAGTYDVYVLGVANTNRGKIDWAMDGTNFITGQDWYAASAGYNAIKTGAVAISTPGRHALAATVNGKNAGSSGYAMTLTAVWLIKQ